MTNVLDDIVRRTRERLRDEPVNVEDLRRKASVARRFRPNHAFAAACVAPRPSAAAAERDRVNIIAEIKAASPSAGAIVDNPDIESIASEYKRGGAAAISIVAEPEFFRGSREWLARA